MSIYRGSRGNVDLAGIAGKCRFTAYRGRMSIYRGSRGNVDLSRIAGECRCIADRGGMSIHRGSRRNGGRVLSESTSDVALIASYQSNAFQSNTLCEIPNATHGYDASDPGFLVGSVITLPGGLMDKSE
jgi:hypothetical protein